MKKIAIIILGILLFYGCNLTNTPTSVVEKYLDDYISLNDNVLENMEMTILDENLSSENRDIYKEVLSRQYENLKYEIKDESINGEDASVLVKISVYDLYKSMNDSTTYMNENYDEFVDDNNMFNQDMFTEYQLNNMLIANDIVEYEITFNLAKKDGNWVLKEPNRETLEKIHGLYNYD